MCDPFLDCLRKWNPTKMREAPFSSLACEKLVAGVSVARAGRAFAEAGPYEELVIATGG